jgi:predicted acylesterase/phospholipase RssA
VPGFAHVALLRGLRNEAPALPIDIVAGTSIGSLVGAWYVGRLANPRREESTLESLLNQGRLLNLLMPAAMVDSHLLERWLNRVFPVHDQTQFEVPFAGVSTDVLSATVWTCDHGTLGSAARKSSAFAPMFPPVLVPGGRLLDGGFADNVPVAVVRALGGAFVIGSNAVGMSNASPCTEPGATGWRSVLAALNPIARMESALHGGFVIFHRLGDFESRMANVAYEAAYSGDRFWDFSHARDVVAQTQAAATAFAIHTGAMWRAWVRPRRSAR